MSMEFNYEVLEDWSELESVSELGPLPSPDIANAVVARTPDGEIAGVLFLQWTLHAEPFVVLPEYRESGVSLGKLIECAEDTLLRPNAPTVYHVYVVNHPEVVQKVLDMGFVPIAGVTPFMKFVEE